MATVRILGVRHHSPACARLVAHTIATLQPQVVLVEGPSDFNPRLGELLLDHQLPLAIYSYANPPQGEGAPAQCWFPLLGYSPEWVALREGQAAGAQLRFMDLPHWRYRALPEGPRRTAGNHAQRSRYAQVVNQLCRRFGCDGDDALWDHLFESAGPALPADELAARLDLYFSELRGDEPGGEQDQAREACMAQWLAWAAARHQRVLAVCGGWHQPALARRLQQALAGAPADLPEEPPSPQPPHERAAGSYLVPFEYRQVDALGGYAAGMPSPRFYQWLWQHGAQGAAERAEQAMLQRLREAGVTVSTADRLAWQRGTIALAALRGHPQPLRVDLLDALQSTVVKEALDAPAPWTDSGPLQPRHHPVLREALLALTGEGGGRLHADTPLPPLLHDVHERLAACGLQPGAQTQTRVLDRRRREDLPASRVLWQLRCLPVQGVQLTATRAPQAARGLARELAFEEHWRFQQDERWYPDLIEASVHGATLAAAAQQALLHRLAQAGSQADALAEALMQAVRAGLLQMGQSLATQLHAGLAQAQDHGALARAAHTLAGVVQAGFWGEDPRALLEDTLVLLAERLLWLLEGRDGNGAAALLDADVQAVAVFDRLLRLDLPGLDAALVLHTLQRLAASPTRPPALRGAALGVACRHDVLGAQPQQPVLAVMRSLPPREGLGDFLYGLFSCARALATGSDAIVGALHTILQALGDEDFLVALPALRGAFSWFPARERGQLATQVARLLGLAPGGQQRLLQLRGGPEAWLDAHATEAQALAWARQFGLLP